MLEAPNSDTSILDVSVLERYMLAGEIRQHIDLAKTPPTPPGPIIDERKR